MTVGPSMPGSIPSTTIASGTVSAARRSPSSPVLATTTRYPALSNTSFITSRNDALSSITRMWGTVRSPAPGAAGPRTSSRARPSR
jgi:hypothetical protein